ncbi:unnamed protein product [Paramecium octaurelia]|uniref:Transmembrane protein n=1 Tax=Paramecium octaurelia TaxID=43137 RepID=A0A8S1U4J5_PAROT|nr:unnamed protein product [Paramecium octaurelia]
MQDNSIFGIIQESNWNSVCFTLKCQRLYVCSHQTPTRNTIQMTNRNSINVQDKWIKYININTYTHDTGQIQLKLQVLYFKLGHLKYWMIGDLDQNRILEFRIQLLSVSFAENQYTTYQTLSINMILFSFCFMRPITHYIREDFMLQTWDIIAKNFGFMFVWGDIVYLLHLSCIGGWCLGDFVQNSSTIYLILITLLHLTSLYMNRDSNWLKDRYRRLGDQAII